jgi:hypothetical protein
VRRLPIQPTVRFPSLTPAPVVSNRLNSNICETNFSGCIRVMALHTPFRAVDMAGWCGASITVVTSPRKTACFGRDCGRVVSFYLRMNEVMKADKLSVEASRLFLPRPILSVTRVVTVKSVMSLCWRGNSPFPFPRGNAFSVYYIKRNTRRYMAASRAGFDLRNAGLECSVFHQGSESVSTWK